MVFVVKIFHPEELEPSPDTGVASPEMALAQSSLKMTRSDPRVQVANQVYLFPPYTCCSFAIGKKGRLTVNLDV
jgi:hypothetical protein